MPGKVIQKYNIAGVYDRYAEHVKEKVKTVVKPHDAILNDAQIIHDTLNNREKFDIYMGFTNRWVKDRVETMGVTPMRALTSIIGSHQDEPSTKLSKLFEVTTGEIPFLKSVEGLRSRPFHDVSAGLHHGEYEHGMQMHFIRDMYLYRYLYGTTGLRTNYQTIVREMMNPAHIVTTLEGDQLSLWSLVMDIQGGFIRGQKQGIRFLYQEHEEDPYAGTFGTSATLMHYGFGWGKKNEAYTSMEHGELARQYPYIAEAVLNRGLKRSKEATGKGPFHQYLHVDLSSQKEEIAVEAQKMVSVFNPEYVPPKWQVRFHGGMKTGDLRTNVLL